MNSLPHSHAVACSSVRVAVRRFCQLTTMPAGCWAVLVACWLVAESAFGGDWPDLLGPNRDGHAVGEQIEPWRETPGVRWRFSCGEGYAGVAVAGDRVLLWHRRSDREVLTCLSAKSGQELWSESFPAIYAGGVDPDTGPRCVPVISQGLVLVYGAGGDLHAVDLESGQPKWSRHLRTELDADDGYFGAGSTPLVLGDMVIVEVGGRNNAGLLGLALADGTTRWNALSSEASYASPVSIQLNNKTYVVAPMRLETVVVDPANGQVFRQVPFGKPGPTVVAATPLVDGTQVFLTASYGVGCALLDLSEPQPANEWRDTSVISSQYATPVRVGDYLYAITGREDFNDAGLVCVRWKDGEERWAQPSFGTAHLIAAGNHVLAQQVSGKLVLFEADDRAFKMLATMDLPTGAYRSLPALADEVLYCRRTSSRGDNELLAIELSGQ